MTQPHNPFVFSPGTGVQAERQAQQTADAAMVRAVGDTQAATAGQGFTLHEGEARTMLNRAYEISDQLTTLKAEAETLQELTPPAQDQASQKYNQRLTDGASFFASLSPWSMSGAFDAGVAHIDAEIAYVNAMIENLEKALGITRDTEQANTDALNKTAAASDVDTTEAGQTKGRF